MTTKVKYFTNTIIFLLYLAGMSSSNVMAVELPLLADEAREQGYIVPKPFGISIGSMRIEQDIIIDKVGFSNLALGPQPLENDAFKIHAAPGSQKNWVNTFRADVWLLPFLNLYALGGKVTGDSDTLVTIQKIHIPPMPPIESPMAPFDFKLDLDGYLYGGGLVLAGSRGNWFAMIDASITRTNLTVLDGNIDAFVVSPKLGYDFADQGLPLKIWLGGMYQHVDQNLTGYIHKLALPPQLDAILKMVDGEGEGRFNVEQQLSSPWNTLVGLQYQMFDSFSIIGEVGFGGRKNAMLSLEYRF